MTEIVWQPISVEPQYKFHVGGSLAVILLLCDKFGIVMDGDYTNGKYHTCGVPNPNITHWAHYPDPPEEYLKGDDD